MSRSFLTFCAVVFGTVGAQIVAQSGADSPTRFLAQPAVSETHLVFTYANDLWVADPNGQNPRRLTVDPGQETNPVLSPDGTLVAFTGEYEGNGDVYVVPITGGLPRRLTWHPGNDEVFGFTPDGRYVLFGSRRDAHFRSIQHTFRVRATGGAAEPLGVPTTWGASLSGDGDHLAYSPMPPAHAQWKHYRGGRISRIWIQNLTDSTTVEIPQPEGGSNDLEPRWLAGQVYFRSDRDGEFNVYRYDPASKAVERLTNYQDFPVLSLAAHRDRVVFEQAARLHELDLATSRTRPLDIKIQTDLPELRPRYVSDEQFLRWARPSPSAARVVVGYRGEVLTLPGEQGDVINLTNTPGAHERMPAWSPDGKTIAYFSDASGEYQLHLYDVSAKTVRSLALEGAGFYGHPHWSPDSKKLVFVDNSRTLYCLEVDSEKITAVASDAFYTPGAFRDLFGSWSPDSRWLAYSRLTTTNFERAYLFDTEAEESTPITDGLSNVTEPTFDPTGQYLYLAASTDAGPVVNWFQQSNLDMRSTNSIYLITLRDDIENPLKRQNDREEIGMEDESKQEESDSTDTESSTPVVIDFAGMANRIIDLPVPPGSYDNLSATEAGLLFIARSTSGPAQLKSFELKSQETEVVMPANWFVPTADGQKMLFGRNGGMGIADLGQEAEPALNLDALEVRIDPRAEWENIFDEAWRVNRDYFYDPDMHGADWPAMREKYAVFLDEVPTQNDFYRLIRWMVSELAVGHSYLGRPVAYHEDEREVKGGLLGADYTTENGRYRFAKIYGGLNWNPQMRSPLTEPGVNIEQGDYLLAVDGQELTATDNLYRLFERTLGRTITLTVSSDPDGSDRREVEVVPVEDEYALRNRDWVEGNLRQVTEATDGRVAYVYVPNTTGAGHQYFKRYFFPQVNREAIIVDERFNGGGQIADYYIELLTRKYQNSWTYRYGQDQHAPVASITGPKVLLVNEAAGSGGDLFPYLWRQAGLGPIIGKRTWGGLVGVLGFPTLMDGGQVTAPNVGFWDEDGFRVENEGITPDISVEQLPRAIMRGEDPQLERAIEEVLRLLEAEPVVVPERPPFERRVER